MGHKKLRHVFHNLRKRWGVVCLVLWLARQMHRSCESRDETQTWVMPVRRTQNSESSGLHAGFTKDRNSEIISRIPSALSLHPSRQTGHSWGYTVSEGRGVQFRYACNDLVWIVHARPFSTRRLDIKDQNEVVRLEGRLWGGRG